MHNVIDLFNKRPVVHTPQQSLANLDLWGKAEPQHIQLNPVPENVLDLLGVNLPLEKCRNTVSLVDLTREIQIRYEQQVRADFVDLEKFLRAGRFGDLVATRESAYRYAELLISCCEDALTVRTLSRRPLDDLLCAALNDWLSPTPPFTRYPSALVLASAMFGNAWARLTQLHAINGSAGPLVRPALVANRPAFLPGLVGWLDTPAL
jgi:hypothetical protein